MDNSTGATIAYLSLGSNMGDRLGYLQQAYDAIAALCGPILHRSSFYQTPPWGLQDQPDFINSAIGISTRLRPDELLHAIRQIETQLGRQRHIKWGPRTIDIDILFYGDKIVHTADLDIPHPFLHQRRFVLAPLAEIAPDFIHPELKLSVEQLLSQCTDDATVTQLGPGN